MDTKDKMEMLRWLSLRNTHMAPSELAFLLDVPLADAEAGDVREGRAVMPWSAAYGLSARP